MTGTNLNERSDRLAGLLTRRDLLLAGGLALGGAAVLGTRWFNLTARVGDAELSVEAAHAQALAGEITLIDIRRPDEWARTGIAEGAQPLDMRRADFVPALTTLLGGDRSAPVALICARGVRSRRMAALLDAEGFTRVMDVPEGMLGSGAGQGWLRKGLPVVAP